MGYILFLAKRQDGLCLWVTEATDCNATKAYVGCDVLAELREFFDRLDLGLALSLSRVIPEVHSGDASIPLSGAVVIALREFSRFRFFGRRCPIGPVTRSMRYIAARFRV